MLLIYGDFEANMIVPGTPEFDAYLGEYLAFTTDVTEAGIVGGAEELQDPKSAKTLRVRDGESLLSDGPFAESKEQLGGFYIIDVASFEEAASWAARIPDVRSGAVEIRPIMVRDASNY